MTLSEAKKKANRKWDAANLVSFNVRLNKTKAERFRAAAAAAGKTPSAVIKESIDKFIQDYEK